MLYRPARFFSPILALLFLLIYCQFVFAQVSVKGYAPKKGEQRSFKSEAPLSRRYSQVRYQNAPVYQLGRLSQRELRGEIRRLKDEKRLRIGAVRSLPRTIDSASEVSFHDVSEGRVGIFRLTSEGALAIRARLDQVLLPENANIFVSSAANSDEYYGPFTSKDVGEERSIWTPPVQGDSIVIEFLVPAGSESIPFSVSVISHIFSDLWSAPQPGKDAAGMQQVGQCNNNVPAEWAEAAKSVGLVQIVNSKGEFGCTGVLLNTANNSGIPYFLSANHCLSSQSEATSMIVRWFNYTGSGSSSDSPISYSGTLLSTGEASDYTLIRLRSVPDGVRFSGWTTADPAISTQVTSIHHPGGSYQRYSRGNLTAADCSSFIGEEFCGNFHKVRWESGITEPGSSGGPLWIGSRSDPQLIGVLSGGTSSCNNRFGIDVFNRFDVAFKAFSQYLTGEGCVWELSERGRIVEARGESATVNLKGTGDKKDCAWEAIGNVSWITITSNPAGAGEAAIRLTIAPNAGNNPRYGAVYIAGRQFFVVQVGSHHPGNCPPLQFNPGGNALQQNLTASSCRSIVNLDAFAQRITFEGLAGQQLMLSASSGEFDPMMLLLEPDGTIVEFNDDSRGVASRIPGDSRADFVTLPSNGTYTLEVTSYEPGETGLFFLNSSKYCQFKLPSDHSIVSSEGATLELDVTGPPDCSYQAVSQAPWIRFEKGTGYTGAQKVKVIVDPATEYAYGAWADKRSSVISIAGRGFNVIQQLKCGRYLSLQPSAEHSAQGVYGALLSFTTGFHCDWSLSKDSDWIKFEGSPTGRGYIETKYTIDTVNLNSNPRVGKIMAGDTAFTVTQLGVGASCQPTSIEIGQTITGKLSGNCKTLTSEASSKIPANYYTFSGTAGQKIIIAATSLSKSPWDHPVSEMRLVSPSKKPLNVYASAQRFAEGALKQQMPENGYLTLPESGTYTLALGANRELPTLDVTFLLTIADGGGVSCELGLSSLREARKSAGDTGKIDVILQADSQCRWTATSTVPWITITSGAAGTGNGSFTYSVAPNADSQLRTGVIVAAGRHVLVTQYPNLATTVSSADYLPRFGLYSLASVFGTRLAVRTESAIAQPLPIMLGGTSVKLLTAHGSVWECGLIFVSGQQINFVLPPSDSILGESLVEIKSEDGTVIYSPLFIERAVPSVFSANASGLGVASAQMIRVKPDNSQVWEDVFVADETGKRVARELKLGPDNETEYLVLYGTGFGLGSNLFEVIASVGGEQCQVVYIGPQYSFAGLSQANILLPKSLRGRGEVPIKIELLDKESNIVTVRFAP